MAHSPLINQLIDSLKCLPGVGAKSAQRMAYHLLERDRNGARKMSHALTHFVISASQQNVISRCFVLLKLPRMCMPLSNRVRIVGLILY